MAPLLWHWRSMGFLFATLVCLAKPAPPACFLLRSALMKRWRCPSRPARGFSVVSAALRAAPTCVWPLSRLLRRYFG